MGFAFSTSTREVLEQVVRDPRFRPLTTIPLIAPLEIGLIVLAFGLFALGTFGFLHGALPWPAMVLINAFAVYVSFTPLHDATHRSLSSNRVLNDVLGTISCLLLIPGITTGSYRYLHLEHHRHTGSPTRDPDDIMVTAPFWQLPFILGGIDVVWIRWYVARWGQRPKRERRVFAGSVAFYVLLHVVWLSSPYWREFLLCWLIPQHLGMFGVAFLFAHIQHPAHVTWEEAPFQTTVRLLVPAWLRVLLLGQAKHCVHHFAPSLPFYRYHEAWQIGRHLFEAQGIPTRTIFTQPRDLVLPARGESATWLDARVTAMAPVGEDIMALDLVPDRPQVWPDFAPGAHIDVEIAPGLVRQYSLCNQPDERDRYRIAVKREAEGRGGSRRLHDEIAIGRPLRVSAPRNHFPLSSSHTRHVLIAGGIGLTPLLAMAHALKHDDQPFVLHVFARALSRVPFHADLQRWFGDEVQIHLDQGDGGNRARAAAIAGAWTSGAALYVCGPTGFMANVIEGARRLGWPDKSIFSETFIPRASTKTENRPFEVELARSKRVLTVAADENLLDVLHANDIAVICACTQGICGSCLTPVLDGVPEHRDSVLSDAERDLNRQMTVCVSRAVSQRLVLDL